MAAIMEEERRGAEIRLTGLSRSYGDNKVVADVDLVAGGGEVLALLGPSGCGKTTTLRMIAGLVRPTSGEVAIDGVAVTALPVHQRNLGMLFQNYALFPHLNVLDNVAFGLTMRGMAKGEAAARARQALAQVRLSGFEERMPAALSGGQQQRVALARAIVYHPRALLLDEPFAALDKKLREEMQIEVRQLANELGLTTIIVTHDQEEALVLADRIAVMKGGRIEQVADARAIYERPATHFVADFIGSSNFLEATIVELSWGRTTLRDRAGVLLESAIAHDAGRGEQVTLAVRPENVLLSPAGDVENGPGQESNVFSGKVLRTVFKGQTLSVWLERPDGGEFIATLSGGTGPGPGPGEKWTVRFSPERSLIVRNH
ncbi:ABC transporter ATP-binding protein [Martelella sp. HB161492]|uniref:ABC transporter ATP-binding protein n=1 Tax=Martelella sp. HB161492 TaxID=2720726 RepID=UPI00158FF80C|nr:ABC transporter ATP-binding protein [Martelella sp. HB161492]